MLTHPVSRGARFVRQSALLTVLGTTVPCSLPAQHRAAARPVDVVLLTPAEHEPVSVFARALRELGFRAGLFRAAGTSTSELQRVLAAARPNVERPTIVFSLPPSGDRSIAAVFAPSRMPNRDLADLLAAMHELAPPRLSIAGRRLGQPSSLPAFVDTSSVDVSTAGGWTTLDGVPRLRQQLVDLVLAVARHPHAFRPGRSQLEVGAVARTRDITLHLIGNGINSPPAAGKSDLARLAESRTRRDTHNITINIAELKQAGFSTVDSTMQNEVRDRIRSATREASRLGRDLVVEVNTDMKPYLSLKNPGSALDYLWPGNSKWKNETATAAAVVDATVSSFRATGGKQVRGFFHSQGGDVFKHTEFSAYQSLDLVKIRSGGSALVDKLKAVKATGTTPVLHTGRGDLPTLWGAASKGAAESIARKTGAVVVHDPRFNGHGIPLKNQLYEVYNGSTRTRAKIAIDPFDTRWERRRDDPPPSTTPFSGGPGQPPGPPGGPLRGLQDPGGVWLEAGNTYSLTPLRPQRPAKPAFEGHGVASARVALGRNPRAPLPATAWMAPGSSQRVEARWRPDGAPFAIFGRERALLWSYDADGLPLQLALCTTAQTAIGVELRIADVGPLWRQ